MVDRTDIVHGAVCVSYVYHDLCAELSWNTHAHRARVRSTHSVLMQLDLHLLSAPRVSITFHEPVKIGKLRALVCLFRS